jgi:hypothetical protein
VPIGLITMNDVLVHERVDGRLRFAIAAARLLGIAAGNGVIDLTHGGAHA